MARLQISSFSHLNQVIVPFFDQYSILGNKALDYADFRKVLSLMSRKEHLTYEGLAKCQALSDGMNTGRDCTLESNRVMIVK